ncbi:MAG: hypothetical protein CMH70_09065 [Nitrosomonadaceae bacterium]|nr:hypothetical protein [Nitrosomonadaceae bacterium]|tara:strand:+ start:60 stop:251 length:192 start_codon:yes stop_codon:yes gene_type:complete
MKILLLTVLILLLNACSTTVAILDVAGSAVIYTGKTAINTVDMITPDLVNREEEGEEDKESED